MTTHQLSPHAALLTGASRGIGLALARRLVEGGARVLVTGRDEASLAGAAAAVPGLLTLSGDLGRADDRERLAAHVVEHLPDLDLLINNAGIQRRVSLAEDGAPWAERAAEVRLLLEAPIHLTELLLPLLRGEGRPATIVEVTSGGALVPQPFAPLYSAAKAGLHSHTTTLRHALRDTAVRVVELMPPAVATGLSGLDVPHGAPVEEFADAVLPRILAGEAVVGYGPTDTEAIRDRLAVERAMFEAAAERFPVPAFTATRPPTTEVSERR